ncbi:MAG: NUDIX domain-containing protein [Pseudomonadales bacterium]|nr:NUDIX domain-containing protein [Pseudomonadales bacterium]
MTKYNPNHSQEVINYLVGQKVVIFNSEGQILFLRRSEKCTRAGGWDFPGGGLENEQPTEGIKREAREEVGIEVSGLKPVALISHESKEPGVRVLLVGYVAYLKSGNVKLSWEHDAHKWLKIDEALKVDLPEGHRKFLDAAIESWETKYVRIPSGVLL